MYLECLVRHKWCAIFVEEEEVLLDEKDPDGTPIVAVRLIGHFLNALPPTLKEGKTFVARGAGYAIRLYLVSLEGAFVSDGDYDLPAEVIV